MAIGERLFHLPVSGRPASRGRGGRVNGLVWTMAVADVRLRPFQPTYRTQFVESMREAEVRQHYPRERVGPAGSPMPCCGSLRGPCYPDIWERHVASRWTDLRRSTRPRTSVG